MSEFKCKAIFCNWIINGTAYETGKIIGSANRRPQNQLIQFCRADHRWLGVVSDNGPHLRLTNSKFHMRLLFSGNHLRLHILIDPYFERRYYSLAYHKLFRNVHMKVWPHNYNLDLNCFPYPIKR